MSKEPEFHYYHVEVTPEKTQEIILSCAADLMASSDVFAKTASLLLYEEAETTQARLLDKPKIISKKKTEYWIKADLKGPEYTTHAMVHLGQGAPSPKKINKMIFKALPDLNVVQKENDHYLCLFINHLADDAPVNELFRMDVRVYLPERKTMNLSDKCDFYAVNLSMNLGRKSDPVAFFLYTLFMGASIKENLLKVLDRVFDFKPNDSSDFTLGSIAALWQLYDWQTHPEPEIFDKIARMKERDPFTDMPIEPEDQKPS